MVDPVDVPPWTPNPIHVLSNPIHYQRPQISLLNIAHGYTKNGLSRNVSPTIDNCERIDCAILVCHRHDMDNVLSANVDATTIPNHQIVSVCKIDREDVLRILIVDHLQFANVVGVDEGYDA